MISSSSFTTGGVGLGVVTIVGGVGETAALGGVLEPPVWASTDMPGTWVRKKPAAAVAADNIKTFLFMVCRRILA